jgi:hypothetical protein
MNIRWQRSKTSVTTLWSAPLNGLRFQSSESQCHMSPRSRDPLLSAMISALLLWRAPVSASISVYNLLNPSSPNLTTLFRALVRHQGPAVSGPIALGHSAQESEARTRTFLAKILHRQASQDQAACPIRPVIYLLLSDLSDGGRILEKSTNGPVKNWHATESL